MSKPLEPFCFWCGGNPRYEFQAPPRPFFEDKQTMCDSCANMRGTGIVIFELIETDPGCGNPTMCGGKVYYTGRWTVVDGQLAAQIFPRDVLEGVMSSGIAGLRHDNYAKAGFDKYPGRTIQ